MSYQPPPYNDAEEMRDRRSESLDTRDQSTSTDHDFPSYRKLFIQMSGAPGSGKSSMAKLLASAIDGIVIDHDILRSSFLDADIPFHQAAKHAYDLQWRLAEDFIKQGVAHSIIIDSTCNYLEVLNRVSFLAAQHNFT
ncbi:uncharacterized protein RAG0_15527 [Rhynchosporium agropyri]|uniref:Uncharacterized protein n=1 Tax=Rhynchosporium agropyri TaxID=914238 RepID=A0A1E1LLG5_9HELO|nr:uncharacterized protein RAG0_15527 [Rhynchosporium agropyri]